MVAACRNCFPERKCQRMGSCGPSETKYEQHRLIAHVAKLGRHRVDVQRIAVEPRLNRHILFTADLKGHGRSVDAASEVEVPQAVQGGIIVGGHRPVGEAGDQEATCRSESGAVVGIRDVQPILDLAREWVCDHDVGLVA